MTVSQKIPGAAFTVVSTARGSSQRKGGGRAQKAEATRTALLQAARELLTTRGYHEVGVRDFAAAAGVTRGAFYHHFPGKQAMFLAVFDAVESELTSTAADKRDPSLDLWTAFRAGIKHYLVAVTRPDVQRITLIDGPAVLGWERWREIEQRYSLGSITSALAAAMSSGRIRKRPVEPLAHLIFGSVMEAALLVAHSKNPKRRAAEVGEALDDLLGGLS
ncbi:MAG: tetC [Hydrocarboniphaga sp.]|uniref:TetR/AcrR family transcriptional regulator n=1 Tax=Hydrocarboniphaga sp. TaxID=2033016 RepID=UPI0026190021|nr:TetR/AcrR family transcriptional regulator [Hydrocarboniphaga sp.]MDB5969902.1 tetC [Hydrocarboniphaga sp.]